MHFCFLKCQDSKYLWIYLNKTSFQASAQNSYPCYGLLSDTVQSHDIPTTKPHRVTTQKIKISIFTAMRTPASQNSLLVIDLSHICCKICFTSEYMIWVNNIVIRSQSHDISGCFLVPSCPFMTGIVSSLGRLASEAPNYILHLCALLFRGSFTQWPERIVTYRYVQMLFGFFGYNSYNGACQWPLV